jgi:hypothetical protein
MTCKTMLGAIALAALLPAAASLADLAQDGAWLSAGQGPADWHFRFGPAGAPTMALERIDRRGFVSFTCRRTDGLPRVQFAIPGLEGEPGAHRAVRFSVQGKTIPVDTMLHHVTEDEAANRISVFQGDGAAVAQILKAMAAENEVFRPTVLATEDGRLLRVDMVEAPDGDPRNRGDGLVIADAGGHSITFDLPRQPDIPLASALDLCGVPDGG